MATEWIRNPARRAWRSVRRRGLRRSAEKVRALLEERLWDGRLGVQTREDVGPAEMDLGGRNAKHASIAISRLGRQVVYETLRIGDLRYFLRSVPNDVARHIVDFGCGKGRVLIAARQLGYVTATGVELSPSLSAIAGTNIDALRRHRPELANGISVENLDASEFVIRPEHNVFYFYNPFGPAVLLPVLNAIAASVQASPRKAWVTYVNPVHRSVFDEHPALETEAELNSENYFATLYRVMVDSNTGS